MTPAPLPLAYFLYAVITAGAAPLLRRHMRRKMTRAGVAPERIKERFGRATLPRPQGRLVWLHAVSVGELLSILGLVQRLQDSGCQVLVTTTTATSAELAGQRLPQGAMHQFSPLDTPGAVRRFLDHWQPDLAVFVESEIWPRQIALLHKRGIPLALIQARLSGKSLRRWQKFPKSARALLQRFALVLCQVDTTQTAVTALGLPSDRAITSGDLKASSDPLPIDPKAADDLRALLSSRPVWLAASTHPGEEKQVAEAHKRLKDMHPDALMILAPRHPERGTEIAQMLRQDGWQVAQRSQDAQISAHTDIYLADTLGEMGLWYALSPIVFIAGSFSDVGGHNPYEAAHFDCAILHGPKVANAAQTYADMQAAGACRMVADAEALGAQLIQLQTGATGEQLHVAAKEFATSAQNIRAEVADRLLALI